MGNLTEVLTSYANQVRREEEEMQQMMDTGVESQIRTRSNPKSEILESRFILVDTKPDSDTEWRESYMCNSWREAYEKMACLMFEESSDELEANLMNGKSFIKIYSAQTYDAVGDKHVFHIIGV